MKRRTPPEKTERITVRFSKKERLELERLMTKSRFDHSISEVIRRMIFKQEITVNTYDQSLDRVLEKLALIRNELRAIGVNINQVTRYFNTYPEPAKKEFYARKIGKLYKGMDSKISDLLTMMDQLGKRWSPE